MFNQQMRCLNFIIVRCRFSRFCWFFPLRLLRELINVVRLTYGGMRIRLQHKYYSNNKQQTFISSVMRIFQYKPCLRYHYSIKPKLEFEKYSNMCCTSNFSFICYSRILSIKCCIAYCFLRQDYFFTYR